MSRFIKYFPTEKAAWLRQYHPNVFLLLTMVAEKAKRTKKNSSNGLIQGDAILGSYEEAGLSRKEYRNAIDKGVELHLWEIVWNFKNPKQQKRAIKGAIKNIVLNLLDNSVWDINLETEEDEGAICSAIKGPLRGHLIPVPICIKESEEAKEAIAKKESDKEKRNSPIAISPFLEKEKEKDQMQEIHDFIKTHDLEISSITLNRWLLKFDIERILENLKLIPARDVERHEAWMQTALKENFAGQQKRIANNRRLAQELKEVFEWSSLTITKNYCREETNGKDYYFTLPESQFEEMIQRAGEAHAEVL